MPHRLHPIKAVHVLVVVAVRPRRSVRLAGDVVLPCCSCRWDGRTVAGGNDFGGGGDEACMMVVEKEKVCLFTICLRVSGKRR